MIALIRSLPRLLALTALCMFCSGCFTVQIRALKTEKQMLEARVLQLQQDNAALLEETQEMRNSESNRDERLIRAEGEIRTLQGALKASDDKLAAAKLALQSSQNSHTREFADRLENAIRGEATLRAELEEARARNASLEVGIMDKGENEAAMMTQAAELRAQLERSTGIIEELNQTIAAQKLSIQGIDQERNRLAQELETERASKSESASDARLVRDKLAAVETELASSKASILELEAALAAVPTPAPTDERDARNAAAVSAAAKAREAMAAQLKSGAVAIVEEPGRVRFLVSSDTLFDSGTTLVSDSGLRTLTAIESFAKTINYSRISVEGHTDNVPVRNMPYPDNWELGAARATEVTRFLASKAHIDAAKVVALSRSSFAPIAEHSTAEGRKKNRRVEVVFDVEP